MKVGLENCCHAYRETLGPLTESQVEGLTFILNRAADDSNWQNVSQLAYAMATVAWETAHHFTPITEYGKREYFDRYEPGTPVGKALGNTESGDSFRFRGRGFVQITGRANYERVGRLIGIDLVSEPDKALAPEVAYRIMSGGMHGGWFTGAALSRFIPTDTEPDFVNARKVINGHDHVHDIAALAMNFREPMKGSRTE